MFCRQGAATMVWEAGESELNCLVHWYLEPVPWTVLSLKCFAAGPSRQKPV